MSEEEGMTQLQGLLGRMWRPEKRLHPYSCVFWPGTRASATKRDFRNVAKCQVARGRASKRSSIGNLLFPRPLRTGLDGKEPKILCPPRDHPSTEFLHCASVWVDILKRFERNTTQRDH